MTEAVPEGELPETLATYLRLRGLEPGPYRRRRARRAPSGGDDRQPFTAGRDPHGVGDVLDDLTRQAGWAPQLARADLARTWETVAGDDMAQHTRPVALDAGLLTVQADSTAWATALRGMRSHILSEILRRFPEAGVESIRFIGPDVPSWKWGPRAIPGRGPRDTYG